MEKKSLSGITWDDDDPEKDEEDVWWEGVERRDGGICWSSFNEFDADRFFRSLDDDAILRRPTIVWTAAETKIDGVAKEIQINVPFLHNPLSKPYGVKGC